MWAGMRGPESECGVQPNGFREKGGRTQVQEVVVGCYREPFNLLE